MHCGAALGSRQGMPPAGVAGGSALHSQASTDWPSIIAAIVAFLSLRGLSRQARGVAVVAIVLVLFFGCPLVCGFIAYFMDWIARLFQ
jgi:hypothetical protein